MINVTEAVDLFTELVKIDSVSGDERKMADRLSSELSLLGGIVQEDEVCHHFKGNTGNIIADFPGRKNKPVLLLSAHMDRVNPGQGIIPVIKDGYIKSRGNTILGGDDLMGIVSIIRALKIINENNLEHHPLKIVFTVAEEGGMLGSKYLDKKYLQGIDYGLVIDGEGPVGTVFYKSPARVKFKAKIRGDDGQSRGIKSLKISSLALSAMKLGKIDDETEAFLDAQTGVFSKNEIDSVILEGSICSFKECKLSAQLVHMKKIINKYAYKLAGNVDYEIEKLYNRFILNKNSDFFKILNQAGDDTGIDIKYRSSKGGSDANIFNTAGIPAVNLGTGIKNVHSQQEQVEIKNLKRLISFIVSIIKIAGSCESNV